MLLNSFQTKQLQLARFYESLSKEINEAAPVYLKYRQYMKRSLRKEILLYKNIAIHHFQHMIYNRAKIHNFALLSLSNK